MIGHLCHPAGSDLPVLVLDRRALPSDERALNEALLTARGWLAATHKAEVTTVTMIEPSGHPDFDLDYQFARHAPGSPEKFVLQGSCGHSLLASLAVADRLAWLPRHGPSSRLRVNILNTGHRAVCEVDRAGSGMSSTTEFDYTPPRRLGDLLPAGVARLWVRGVPVSVVSAGNPYVFVDAAALGVRDEKALFGSGAAARFWRLTELGRETARLLGPEAGGLLRVAAVGQYQYRRLAVRTLPQSSDDPVLAPGDSVTLAAAAAIEGTVPYRLARRAWSRLDELVIDTPGGTTVARLTVSGSAAHDTLTRAGIRRSTVRYRGPVLIEPLRALLHSREDELCGQM